MLSLYLMRNSVISSLIVCTFKSVSKTFTHILKSIYYGSGGLYFDMCNISNF
jgi:hypothetical protein